jgi:hypothetical protein
VSLVLRDATPADVPVIARFVRRLAEYEQLAHEAVGTEATSRRRCSGSRGGQVA